MIASGLISSSWDFAGISFFIAGFDAFIPFDSLKAFKSYPHFLQTSAWSKVVKLHFGQSRGNSSLQPYYISSCDLVMEGLFLFAEGSHYISNHQR